MLLELGVVAEKGLHGEELGTLHHHLLALGLGREAACPLGPSLVAKGAARGGNAAPLVTFHGTM